MQITFGRTSANHCKFFFIQVITATRMASIVDKILHQPFSLLNYQDKIRIKNEGPPRPKLKNLTQTGKSQSRGFCSETYYTRFTWLTGSEMKVKLFCWSCLLFPSSNNETWQRSGFCDLKNLQRALERHSKSSNHIQAEVKLQLLGTTRIEHEISEAEKVLNSRYNEKVKKNREYLERLIDCTVFLATQEQGFRGHDEKKDSSNRGNYMELVLLLSKYDELTKMQLESASAFQGTSSTIQNELIEVCSEVIQDHISEEINLAPFFSVQVDETTDISGKSQLSIIIRYVTEDGQPKERFMGFFNVSRGKTAEDLKNILVEVLKVYNFESKLVCQTYDGAAVMASELNGLQKKIKELAPYSIFIHCYAHKLNLVLSQSAGEVKEARIFFQTLTGFPAFFSHSSKRMQALEENGCPRVPSHVATRWNSLSRLISMIYSNRDQLVKVFTWMIENDNFDDESVRNCKGFISFLQDFEFVFLLYVFNSLFERTEILFEYLQNQSYDIKFCSEKIKNTKNFIQNCRTHEKFEEIFNEVANIIQQPVMRGSRLRSTNILQHYRAIYFEILDNVLAQMEVRFKDTEQLEFMKLIDKSKFEQYKKSFPEALFSNFSKTYDNIFDFQRLKSELKVFYDENDLTEELNSVNDFAKSFCTTGLKETLHELYKLFLLIITIPVTSSSTERSFSCLKRIKTYSRSTCGQNRLSHLALISIEKELVKSIKNTHPKFYDTVIEKFAEKKIEE